MHVTVVKQLEVTILHLVERLNNDLESFQNGVDSIVDKCTSCGSTPSSNTPTAIVTAIQNIYTNRYNTGYSEGKTEGENAAFTITLGVTMKVENTEKSYSGTGSNARIKISYSNGKYTASVTANGSFRAYGYDYGSITGATIVSTT